MALLTAQKENVHTKMTIQLEDSLNVYLSPIQDQLKRLHAHYQAVQELELEFAKEIEAVQSLDKDVRKLEANFEDIQRKPLPPMLSPLEFTASISVPAQVPLSHQSQLIEDLKRECKMYRELNNGKEKHINDLITERNAIVTRNNEEIKSLKKTLTKVRQCLQEAFIVAIRMTSDNASATSALENSFKLKEDMIREGYQTMVSSLQKKHKDDHNELSIKHQRDLQEIQQKHEVDKSQLQTTLTEQLVDSVQQNIELKDKCKALTSQLQSVRKNYEDQIAQQEVHWQSTIDTLNAEASTQKYALIREFESKIASKDEDWTAQLHSERQIHLEEATTMRTSLQSELDNLNTLVSTYQDQIQQMNLNHKIILEEHAQQFQQSQLDTKRKFDEEKQMLIAEYEMLLLTIRENQDKKKLQPDTSASAKSIPRPLKLSFVASPKKAQHSATKQLDQYLAKMAV